MIDWDEVDSVKRWTICRRCCQLHWTSPTRLLMEGALCVYTLESTFLCGSMLHYQILSKLFIRTFVVHAITDAASQIHQLGKRSPVALPGDWDSIQNLLNFRQLAIIELDRSKILHDT